MCERRHATSSDVGLYCLPFIIISSFIHKFSSAIQMALLVSQTQKEMDSFGRTLSASKEFSELLGICNKDATLVTVRA